VVLEGESLVNDASALILYRAAIVATLSPASFSLGESVVRFFIDAGLGTAIGLLVAWLIIRALHWTRDSLAEVLLTLSGPYVAWVAAETIHVSAVLACVAGGLYLRQHLSMAVAPVSRLQINAVWELVVFLLNAMIFLMLGAQFSALLRDEPAAFLVQFTRAGLIIALIAIAVRAAWVPLGSWLPRRLSRELRWRDQLQPWKEITLISWTSMRGIVSLAAALALPRFLADGTTPFPYRTEILVITMTVIVVTLLLQGLTLAPIIRAFAFVPDRTHLEEERIARLEALRRGAEALEDQSREPWVDRSDVEWLRNEVRDRLRLHDRRGGEVDGRRRLRMGMINAERRMLVRLRNEGAISDEVLRQLEQELDLEAIRAGAGANRQ
jgi:CPA1 family monovalent cation:H+ antiporter